MNGEDHIDGFCDLENSDPVLQFLSNHHWVRDDVAAATETVTRRIKSLIEQWNQDNSWDHTEEKLQTDNKAPQADHHKDKKVQGDARRYPTLMAEVAKNKNTTVTLGTGQGKTLIAMMTIRHFRDKNPRKQTWFLVPSEVLAIQQAEALKVNLPYSIGIAVNAAISSNTARHELSRVDILVATHDSALNLLRHHGNKFNFNRVNLLVMDDCHHAIKQHNYALIMEKFYHARASKHSRPHVLGLTASPILNINSQALVEKILNEIELKLDAQMMNLSNLIIAQDELGVIESKVEELVVYYTNDNVNNNWPNIETSGIKTARLKELDQLRFLYEEFGPLLVKQYCQNLVVELSQNIYDKESTEQYKALVLYLHAFIEFCTQLMRSNSVPHVSNKLVKLENLLSELFNPSTVEGGEESIGIIFVEQQITATALKHYLTTSASTGLAFKCGMLTASSTNIFKCLHYRNQSHRAQQKAQENWLHVVKDTRSVLTKLRPRKLDILISTSLIEEDVDVATCSFVVMLDGLNTTKSYIQCKGRARRPNSKFIVFENESKNPPVSLQQAWDMESHVNGFIGNRPSIKHVQNELQIQNFEELTETSSIEIQALQTGEYRTKLAIVDLSSSKKVMNRYVNAIPREANIRSSRESMTPYLPFIDEFTLILPSHLPQSIRHIHLPCAYRSLTNKKAENEARLALMACVRLHQIEAINDQLLPLSRDDFTKRILVDIRPNIAMACAENSPRTLDADNIPSYYGYVYPILYESESFQSYDSCLGSDGRKLGFLSLYQLQSSVDVTLRHSQFGEVSCKVKKEEMLKVCLNFKEWIVCTSFYEVLFNARWRRRTVRELFLFHDDALKQSRDNKSCPLYIVVSLTREGKLDSDRMWKTIQDYQRSKTERRKAVQMWRQGDPPRLWAPVYSPNTTYVALNPSGSTCATDFPDDKYTNYADYFFQKSSLRFALECPLIEVHHMWNLPSDMKPSFDHQDPETDLLPKDGCWEFPVADASLFLHTTLLPQLLYSVERQGNVSAFLNYCCENIPPIGIYLRAVPLQLITIALTAKSCSLPYTYDRLEYLGDAVLKLLQTNSLLFSSNERLSQWLNCLHEGDLSALRSAMGCNERLQEVAEKYGIDRYIMVTPLDRSLWVPHGLMSNCKAFKPSNDVQADVIEALLGVIYLHHNFDAATHTAETLGLAYPIKDVNVEINDHNSTSNASKSLEEFVTRFLGSRVESNALLDEAFTHPTVINVSVPNYQRLEWLGDAVLCLSVREWLYRQFLEMTEKDLFLLESTMVSNDVLAWLGFQSGIHRYVEEIRVLQFTSIEEKIEIFNIFSLFTLDFFSAFLNDIIGV